MINTICSIAPIQQLQHMLAASTVAPFSSNTVQSQQLQQILYQAVHGITEYQNSVTFIVY